MLNAAKCAMISLLPYLREGQILSSLLKQTFTFFYFFTFFFFTALSEQVWLWQEQEAILSIKAYLSNK